MGQAWIVWNARKIENAQVRKSLVQGRPLDMRQPRHLLCTHASSLSAAYAVVFLLTGLSLLRAQVTEGGGMNSLNWLNIVLFFGLSGYYTYFVLVEPVKVFEGIGKSTS
jgi:hypothetical protein